MHEIRDLAPSLAARIDPGCGLLSTLTLFGASVRARRDRQAVLRRVLLIALLVLVPVLGFLIYHLAGRSRAGA